MSDEIIYMCSNINQKMPNIAYFDQMNNNYRYF